MLQSFRSARNISSGTRFFRNALQVNPYEYIVRHGVQKGFGNESAYNIAMINACRENDIEAIAVTDHFRVKNSQQLSQAAKDAGIIVFPGFEAVSKDGIHLLCLSDLSTEPDQLERILVECGIYPQSGISPTSKYVTVELLENYQQKCKSIFVAAHAAGNGGLLRTLSGQQKTAAWTSSALLACSLPSAAECAPSGLREIILNKNPDYRRDRPLAATNAQDASNPQELNRTNFFSIKMSDVTIKGLRQAFLDPDSRIRLESDPLPEDHIELVSVAWNGRFLDRSAIHCNVNLNVLIGGRGTGKSAIVESIRYVLGLYPLGKEAAKTDDGIIH